MQKQIEAAREQLILVLLLLAKELLEEGKKHVVGGELLSFELLVFIIKLEVLMPLGNDHSCFEKRVQLRDAWGLASFLHYGGAKGGQPPEEPGVLALKEEHLSKVREAH